MINTIIIIILVAIALPSIFIFMNHQIFNISLIFIIIFNIGGLILFYIKSIGLDISFYNLVILFLLIQNILLSIIRLFYNITSNSNLKFILGKMIGMYIQFTFIYPIYYLRLFIVGFNKFILKLSDLINNRVNNLVYAYDKIDPLTLIDKSYDEVSRFYYFTFENNKLLDHKQLFVALFSGLMSQDEFKLPGQKMLIISIVSENKNYFLHKNIFIDENTTIENFLNKIRFNIQAFYESCYPITSFTTLRVKL